MEKDFLARLGVFILIGLNVGGFYVFWPRDNANAKADAKPAIEDKGATHLRPTKPKELSPKSVADAVPLVSPDSQKKPTLEPRPETSARTSPTSEDPVSKLLDQIKKDSAASPIPIDHGPSIPLPPPMLPAFEEKKIIIPERPVDAAKPSGSALPMFPGDAKPKSLPALDADPLRGNVGVTSPLTPRTPICLWTFKTEIAGKQTRLLASLQTSSGAAEFRILCDRFEAKPGASEVVAMGSVTLQGGGIRVESGLVRLALFEPRIVFEDQVVVHPPSGAGSLRSDRFAWELTARTPGVGGNGVPPALGPPK